MKLLAVFFLVALAAPSKVFGSSLDCYKCSADGCKDAATTSVVSCADDLAPQAADANYLCYILNYHDGDISKKQKGCVQNISGENPCNRVPSPEGAALDDCQLCSEPKCNSSSTITASLLVIAAALYARYLA